MAVSAKKKRCCPGILTQHASVSEKELWPLVCPIEMLVTRFSYPSDPSGMFEPFQLHMMLGHGLFLGSLLRFVNCSICPRSVPFCTSFQKGHTRILWPSHKE